MALKKDKLLDSAQRFVLKGQFDRAIKFYQQIVDLEPKEVRYRQKLAELLVRDNRKEEAISHYEDIGRHFAENSYFLKAIAVYKQILRLSPGNTDYALTLASLNHKQGLTGSAMAEYGQVVAQLEKTGSLIEAVKVLEQMIDVDGTHAATRLKYAELLFATGAREAAAQAFSILLGKLRTAGEGAAAHKVAGRLAQLFPDYREELQDTVEAVAGQHAGRQAEQSQPVAEGMDNEILLDFSAPDAFGEAPSAATSPLADQRDLSDHSDHSDHSAAEPAAAPWDMSADTEWPSAFDPCCTGEPPPATVLPEPEGADISPWEEEIEIDLDDDHLAVAVAEAAPDVELSLDFSLDLDFDELDSAPPVAFSENPASAEQPPEGVPSAELRAEFSAEPALADEPQEFEPLGWQDEETQVAEAGAATAAGPAPATRQPRGWEEIYPDLGELALEVLDAEDLESHYDLGIGYKGMGLYGDAIKEFSVAAGNPRRRLDCLALQAACYREKGEPSVARELLQRGRDLEVLSVEERMFLSYELGFLLETTGALEEAILLYREVKGIDPTFHDASLRLAKLAGDEPLEIIDLEIVEGE